MEDTTATATAAGQPQTARGELMDVPPWMSLPAGDRYLAATRQAREVRDGRARSAGRDAVALARELRDWARDPDRVPEGVRWNVRGDPRHRLSFGLPHPGDFPGGLPPARQYPG